MRRNWKALVMAATVAATIVVPAHLGDAATMFCNGYDTWDVPHITRDLKYKVCISYWSGGNLKAHTYAYIENCGTTCKNHVDGYVMSAKLEKPLGTVRWSNPCNVWTEATSSPGSECDVWVDNVADQNTYFATLRVTIFYTDGHSSEISPKLCQRGNGPNNTPSTC